MRDKIDRTVMRALMEVEKLEKLFGNNGAFENAVAEIGGDIGWFSDVRENLKQLYGNIEELHMGAVSHMDEAAKPDFADIDDDGDTEETMKKAAKDKEEKNESLDRIKSLAGIVESEHEEEDDDNDDEEEDDEES